MPVQQGFSRGTAVTARLMMIVVAIVLALGVVATGSAQSSSVVWEEYDVTLDVRSDGSVHVTEDQIVSFDGSFSYGFADIPLSRVESIENISVTIDGEPAQYVDPSAYAQEPGTFTAQRSGSQVSIDYGFEPIRGSDERHVVLEYDARGALRVYEDLEPANQQLWWTAISSQVTDVAPIRDATVSVNLPESVPEEEIIASPENPAIDGSTYTWTRSDLGTGDSFEVRLQFPPITGATVPSWQQLDDQRRQEQQEQEERDAVAGTLLFAGGLIILIGGGLGFSLAWFTRGRDPHVGAIADYIPEPPDDLSPGAAGTLVDERVQTRDMLATVLDLARRGAIVFHTTEHEAGLFGLGGGYKHEIELKDAAKADRPFEKRLLDVMFGLSATSGDRTTLGEFRQSYAQSAKQIAEGFYGELVEHGYFHESPEKTRSRWSAIAIIVPVALVILTFVLTSAFDVSSGFIVFVIVAAVIIAIYGSTLANHMAVKTRKGAESAAKWEAFKRYLEDIDERENLEEGREIFDRYLPYATAFGLEHDFVQKFAAAQVPMPGWFDGGGFGMPTTGGRPMRRGRRPVIIGSPWLGDSGGGGQRGASGSGGGGLFGGFPDLQDTSDAGGRTLQSGSDSFFDMLNTASRAFSGGSGKSGGGSFGSFGGGGGFSGGGGFGGGGGGGGRGFG